MVLNRFATWLLDMMGDGAYCVDSQRRILFWSAAAERITGFSREEVMGKCCAHNILRHVDAGGTNLCEGLCPLAHTMEDGQARQADLFLHHKDGHRVPITVRTAVLYDDEGQAIGGLELFSDQSLLEALRQRVAELEALAFVDALTGVGNRRYLDLNLEQRFDELHRYGFPFGVLALDIDHFKLVNDRYGHGVGDKVLRMVAQTLLHNCRSFDTVARFGGEEFVVILRHVDARLLVELADRLRVLVASAFLAQEDGSRLGVTVSIGASLAHPTDTPQSLLQRTDRYLYAAKGAGRNRVFSDPIRAEPAEPPPLSLPASE